MNSPEALAVGITALAVALAKDRDCDEVNLLGAAFSQLGDTLALIATQRERLEEKKER